MNREIKFRVYIPDHGKYSYFLLNEFDYSDRYLDQHQYPVQQYTGLKDSKGVEIYEGDIVEIGDRKKEVIFNIGMFCIDENYGDIVPISEVDNIIKVIGNIFENPELIKNNE
jgi:uncharacterized phage protein (TIGR01671 family)